MGKKDLDAGFIDVERLLIDGGMLDEYLKYKDLQQRKLFIDSEIEQFGVSEIIRHIIQFNRDDADIPPDERRPIRLYISSRGGEVDSGWSLINTIESSITPVYTINLGYQYSMAFLIGLAGHKRFAMPNAKFLMHDGVEMLVDSAAKIQDRMKFQKKADEREKAYVLQHSRIPGELYDAKFRVEWYMFADEAKEHGFVDYIIGQDCGLSEVV